MRGPTLQNLSFHSQRWKISGPEWSIKIFDRFTCISSNVVYYITCLYFKKLYICETGRRLGDRFREHLRDVEKDDKDASKPVARHFNVPHHTKQHMSICRLSLHLGNTESPKNLEQKFIFQIGTLNPNGYQRALFVPLIYSSFYVTMPPPIAYLLISVFNHTVQIIRSFALTKG